MTTDQQERKKAQAEISPTRRNEENYSPSRPVQRFEDRNRLVLVDVKNMFKKCENRQTIQFLSNHSLQSTHVIGNENKITKGE